MKILSRLLTVSFMALSPMIILAQTADTGYFDDFGVQITGLIESVLIPLVFALALVAFFWGVFKTFILGGGDEEKQQEGKQLMIYAIIGFIGMVALWGIVQLFINVFGIGGGTVPTIPQIPA